MRKKYADTCHDGRVIDGNGYDRGYCIICEGVGCPPESNYYESGDSTKTRAALLEVAAIRAADYVTSAVHESHCIWPGDCAKCEGRRLKLVESLRELGLI